MKKLLVVPLLFFVLGIQNSFAGGAPTPTPIPVPEGVACLQPTVDGCAWFPDALMPGVTGDDDDSGPSISGYGYVSVPVVSDSNAKCVGDDDDCNGGINEGEACNDDMDCPIVGCINYPECATNKLAWEVDVHDTHSSFYDPNPCASTGAKLDFQCSDNITSIPEGCNFIQAPQPGLIGVDEIRCPVEFDGLSVGYCDLYNDDDDLIGPVFIDGPPPIGVKLSGKHLNQPASEGRQRGGKNTSRNGQTRLVLPIVYRGL